MCEAQGTVYKDTLLQIKHGIGLLVTFCQAF